MFILCIGCVLQLILVNSEEPNISAELQPQDALQMSLRHVNDMLAQIDTKIGNERRLLSQLEGHKQDGIPHNGPGHKTQATLKRHSVNLNGPVGKLGNVTRDPQIARIVKEWAVHNPEPDFAHKPIRQPVRVRASQKVEDKPKPATRQNPGTTPTMPDYALMPLIPIDELPMSEPEEVPGLPPGWPFNEEKSTLAITIGTTTTVKPDAKEQLQQLMKTFSIGYSYVAFLGLNNILIEKDAEDLIALTKALEIMITEIIDKGGLSILPEEYRKRLKYAWIWLSVLNIEEIKANARAIQGAFFTNNNALTHGVHELFLEYDSMFDPEEGELLLDIVAQCDKYSAAEHGPLTAAALCRKLVNTFVGPGLRNLGTQKMQSLFARGMRVYESLFPGTRRSEIFNALESFFEIESQDLPDTRRRMGKGTKHMNTKYKGIMRHLINKHPTLFKYFAKHYHRSAKHKHHHSRKRHRTPHHKKHHSNKKQRREQHKLNRKETFTTTTESPTQQTMPEIYPDAAIEMPSFRERPMPQRFSHTFPAFSNTFEPFPDTFERFPGTFEPYDSKRFESSTGTFEYFSTTYENFSTTFKPISTTKRTDPAPFRSISTTTRPIPTTITYTFRKQKRFNIVSERTSVSHKYRISPSILTRRGMNPNKSRHGRNGQLLKELSNRLKTSVTKNAQSTRILDKIVQESSYSDEEKYLKTMLDDAFFHGSDTITSNWTGRARVHRMGGDSDTDEEWVFKSNIYKVFQQPVS